jgi:hypothetical protein
VAAGPADREAAEDGVRRAHLAAGLAPPERVLWFGSPLAGAVAAAVVTGLDADLAVRDPVWDRVRAELEAQGWPRVRGRAGRPVRFWVGALVLTEVRVRVRARVGLHLWGQAWDRTGGEVLTRLTDRIWDLQVGELRRRIDPPLGWPATERLRHQAIAGPPEIAWCAEAEGLGRALPHLEATRRLDGLVQVMAAVGWWWPFERVAVLSERPTVCRRDQQGRPHGLDGPALAYPDGFTVHAWHGGPRRADCPAPAPAGGRRPRRAEPDPAPAEDGGLRLRPLPARCRGNARRP